MIIISFDVPKKSNLLVWFWDLYYVTVLRKTVDGMCKVVYKQF